METSSISFRGWEWVMVLGPVPGLVGVAMLVWVFHIPLASLTIFPFFLVAYGALIAVVMKARHANQKAFVIIEKREYELLQAAAKTAGYQAPQPSLAQR